MAKTKAELLGEAKKLKLTVNEKNTIQEIKEALDGVAGNDSKENTQAEAGQTEVVETTTAKAGKRSAKGQEAAVAKAEKIEHQQHRDEAAEAAAKPKQPVKPTRTKAERRGKNYRKAYEQIEKTKVYSLAEALTLATKTSTVKFDATVELHINLNVDPRHADQNIRANLVLPAGTGKTVKVAVFDDAKVEGADISGVETITKLLEKGNLNFDVLVATPTQMPKLGKYARVLGPRGLMPNPKSGTVTTDVAKAVSEAKAGRVEYRVDSTGIVHLGIGKVSFGDKRLAENAGAVMTSIKASKPASVKGVFIKAVHITTTMGPSITVNPAE